MIRGSKDEVHYQYLILLGIFLFLALIMNMNNSLLGIPLALIILAVGISYFIVPYKWTHVKEKSSLNRLDLMWTGFMVTAFGLLVIIWVMYMEMVA